MLSMDDLFKVRHFDREIIILCVRWYLRFKLSFRDLVEMMAERGISLSHTTIMRWIARYVPEFEKRWNRIIAPRAVSIARHARPRLLHTPRLDFIRRLRP
jgi:transposase-like protein